jgi:hypothetical protein
MVHFLMSANMIVGVYRWADHGSLRTPVTVCHSIRAPWCCCCCKAHEFSTRAISLSVQIVVFRSVTIIPFRPPHRPIFQTSLDLLCYPTKQFLFIFLQHWCDSTELSWFYRMNVLVTILLSSSWEFIQL